MGTNVHTMIDFLGCAFSYSLITLKCAIDPRIQAVNSMWIYFLDCHYYNSVGRRESRKLDSGTQCHLILQLYLMVVMPATLFPQTLLVVYYLTFDSFCCLFRSKVRESLRMKMMVE